MKQPRSYTLVAGAASVALGYALHLSAGDRGPVDWIVIGAVSGTILWSLWRLGRRLARAGGGRAVNHLFRVLTWWIVGLMNTVGARAGAGGTWRWWVGIALLATAVVDTVALHRRERTGLSGTPAG